MKITESQRIHQTEKIPVNPVLNMVVLLKSLRFGIIFFLMVFFFSYACVHDIPRGLIAGHSAGTIRNDGKLRFVQPDGTVCRSITIEIAETPKAHKTGLMGRTGLDDASGMLFLYDRPGYQSFWMSKTLIPLDIIFVSENGKIINIAKETEPMSEIAYHSRGPAQYVIEVPSGFSDRYQLKEGVRIQWHRN